MNRDFDLVGDLVRRGVAIDGIVPTPVGEPLGLATLMLFARCRLSLSVPHIVVDVPLDPKRLRSPRVVIMEEGVRREVINLAETGATIATALDRSQMQLDLKHFLFA
jgi:hypothetical protein